MQPSRRSLESSIVAMREHPDWCRTLLGFVTSCIIASGSVVAPLATNEQQRGAKTTQQRADFTLARGQVGRLRIGMTADEVVALFGQQSVKPVDLQLEGHPSPALELRLGNPSAVRASLTAELSQPTVGNRIFRVRVFDRRFRTADGLGVGSTLGQVRAHHQVQTVVGEDGVYAYVQELQMSFAFDSRRLSIHLPTSARIQSVLVLPPVPENFPNSSSQSR